MEVYVFGSHKSIIKAWNELEKVNRMTESFARSLDRETLQIFLSCLYPAVVGTRGPATAGLFLVLWKGEDSLVSFLPFIKSRSKINSNSTSYAADTEPTKRNHSKTETKW